jgi:hypothetical protein
MDELQVSFQIYGDNSEKHMIVPYNLSLSEALDVAQFILGAPSGSYQLFLGRTKEAVNPLATFQSSKIQPNEKLILVANDKLESWRSASSIQTEPVDMDYAPKPSKEGKAYTLMLHISGNEVKQWTYSILLTTFYEDHPHQFFMDNNSQEREKLEESLRKLITRPLKSLEVDKIIRLWCEDIEQGYQNTSLKV